MDGFDHAVARGGESMFHFHRFKHGEGFAAGDGLAGGCQHAEHLAGHRGLHDIAAEGSVGIGAEFGDGDEEGVAAGGDGEAAGREVGDEGERRLIAEGRVRIDELSGAIGGEHDRAPRR